MVWHRDIKFREAVPDSLDRQFATPQRQRRARLRGSAALLGLRGPDTKSRAAKTLEDKVAAFPIARLQPRRSPPVTSAAKIPDSAPPGRQRARPKIKRCSRPTCDPDRGSDGAEALRLAPNPGCATQSCEPRKLWKAKLARLLHLTHGREAGPRRA